MKAKQWMSTFLLCGCVSLASAQDNAASQPEFKPSGKAIGKVFWNFNHDFTEGATMKNTFELQRAYLGYGYNFSKELSAKVILDGAKSTTASEYTAFLKIAQLDWKMKPEVTVSLGMIGLKEFDTQENFMGYRYVFKNVQDEFAMGTTADLGANLEYVLNDKVTMNAFVVNGEGFTKKQDALGKMKLGANVIVQPAEGLTLKAYASVNEGQEIENGTLVDSTDAFIQNYDFFVGYKQEKFRVSCEYNLMFNGETYNTYVDEKDMMGIVLFGAVALNDKYEVFAHFFNYQSNKLEGAAQSWNYGKEGNSLALGVQYLPVKGVRTSINVRSFMYENKNIDDKLQAMLSFEYSF